MKATGLGLFTLGMALLGLNAQAQVEREAFLELKETQMMRSQFINATGQKELKDLETVAAGTIVAVDVIKLNIALSQQRANPNEVNFLYTNSSGQKVMSQQGFVCGVRVIDVPEEDQRVSSLLQEKDLCVSAVALSQQMEVMDGNSDEVKTAMNDVQLGNTRTLVAMAETVGQQNATAAVTDLANPVIEFVAGNGFVRPLDSMRAVSEFGMRMHPVLKYKRLHKGIDLRASIGTTVMSALPGRVLAQRIERSKSGKMKGYGKYLIVVHPDRGMETLYAHLSAFKAEAGTKVAAGERVALSGNTGIGTGPHLHFETHNGTSPVNPRRYISQFLAGLENFVNQFFLLG